MFINNCLLVIIIIGNDSNNCGICDYIIHWNKICFFYLDILALVVCYEKSCENIKCNLKCKG